MTAIPAASRSDPGGRDPELPRGPADHRIATAAWIALFATLAVVAFVRIRLASMPLERDEGEYAYLGQLMLQGVPPFREACNMKWPGTAASYAAIMAAFGQSASALRIGLLLVNLGAVALTYVIARRCLGATGAAFAAAAYAVLSLIPAVYGFAGHATHFVVLPALGAVALVQRPADQQRMGRLLLAGALAGLAMLMKQSGAAFFCFLLSWVGFCAIRDGIGIRRAAARWLALAAGFAVPVGLLFGLVAWWGVSDRFWFWTWDYARTYAGLIPWADGFRNFWNTGGRIAANAPVLGAAVAAGAVAVAGRRSQAVNRVFLFGFAAWALLAACPGLFFTGHYFIPVLPAAALLAGAGLASAFEMTSGATSGGRRLRAAAGLAAVLAIAQPLYSGRAPFFVLGPAAASRSVYGFNPFPEAAVIGRYLDAHCPAGASVAVIGSEPEIYFYARRRSATDCLYLYPLTEPQPYAARMEKEFIAQIERRRPEYVVFVSSVPSWYSVQPANESSTVLQWFSGYASRDLTLVGLADLQADGTRYRWTFPERKVTLPTDVALAVFRRRPGLPDSDARAGPAADQ